MIEFRKVKTWLNYVRKFLSEKFFFVDDKNRLAPKKFWWKKFWIFSTTGVRLLMHQKSFILFYFYFFLCIHRFNLKKVRRLDQQFKFHFINSGWSVPSYRLKSTWPKFNPEKNLIIALKEPLKRRDVQLSFCHSTFVFKDHCHMMDQVFGRRRISFIF